MTDREMARRLLLALSDQMADLAEMYEMYEYEMDAARAFANGRLLEQEHEATWRQEVAAPRTMYVKGSDAHLALIRQYGSAEACTLATGIRVVVA